MSFAYAQSLKHARLQAVVDHVGPGASIEFGAQNGMNVVLATIKLQSPPFTPPADGKIVLAGAPLTGHAYAAGRATTARIVDAAGETQVYDLSVGPVGSRADIELSSVDLAPGLEIHLKSGEIVHA
jgi:hypothetical protein